MAAFLVAAPAAAQPVCGERGEFVERLKSRFGEAPVAMGLLQNGGVVEIFTSPEGTWTILVTGTNGVTCVPASGHSWKALPASAPAGLGI